MSIRRKIPCHGSGFELVKYTALNVALPCFLKAETFAKKGKKENCFYKFFENHKGSWHCDKALSYFYIKLINQAVC